MALNAVEVLGLSQPETFYEYFDWRTWVAVNALRPRFTQVEYDNLEKILLEGQGAANQFWESVSRGDSPMGEREAGRSSQAGVPPGWGLMTAAGLRTRMPPPCARGSCTAA